MNGEEKGGGLKKEKMGLKVDTKNGNRTRKTSGRLTQIV